MARDVLLRQHRDFTLLFWGQAVSQFGSRGYGMAIPLWTLSVTGSPAKVGLISSITLVAYTLATLPAGWLTDRFDRRLVMVAADTGSALAAGSLSMVAWFGAFQLGYVLPAVAVLGVGWAVRGTAEQAALPNVVSSAEVPAAVAMVTGRGYATGVAGPPVAAALFEISPWLPFLVDAVSYCVAGVCAAAIRAPLRRTAADQHRSEPAESPLRAVLEGLNYLRRNPFLRTTAVLAAIGEFVVNGTGAVLLIVFVHAHVASYLLGLAIAVAYAAGFLGTALVRLAGPRRAPHTLLVIARAAGTAAAIGLAIGSPIVAAACWAALLLVRPIPEVLVTTRWIDLVDDRIRGRVDAAIEVISAVPVTVAPSVIGILLAGPGIRPTGLILAVLMAGVCAATAVSPSIRHTIRRPNPLPGTDVRTSGEPVAGEELEMS
ncbi:MFS transporter [Nocardia sp. NPDC088792]|uniref:MFS transporter n=1 Tax=Nocardia sp. NPDC088792 TaxID=3364332 RepID=UPI0037F5A2D4